MTVFVDMEKSGPMGTGVQHIEKVYKKELGDSGCAPLAGIPVDQSCVFPDSNIRLAAFRKSNLFVRVTCSVRNSDACSGNRRSATAELLTKAVLKNL